MIRWPAILILGTCSTLSAQGDSLLRRPFNAFDLDKNGTVSAEEFPGNPALFSAMDKNRDKRVTFEEYKVSSLAKRYLAAMKKSEDEPRKRVSTGELANKRLELIARFDPNKDGRITRREWTGSPTAFLSLDVDGNGVIDKKDRTQVQSEAQMVAKSLNRLPKTRSPLPNTSDAFDTYDKNKDGLLTAKEVGKSPFRRLFDYTDSNKDKMLDREEVERVVVMVNALVDQRNQGYAHARAPTIPFKSWDKNDDGRLDLKEWVDRKDLFKLMDTNRDAAVTPNEVLRYKKSFEGTNFLERFDLNGDNRVTREEFAGTRAAFDRADRNGDGVISRRDG